jgi:hypothetical protein
LYFAHFQGFSACIFPHADNGIQVAMADALYSPWRRITGYCRLRSPSNISMYDCQRYSTDYKFFLQVCKYRSAASNRRIAGRLSCSVLLKAVAYRQCHGSLPLHGFSPSPPASRTGG